MMENMGMPQPFVTTADGRRQFACSPIAVLGCMVNEREEILLLSHPQRPGGWELIAGALEVGETLVEAALRETAEEVGAAVRVRPLGTVHVSTFHYDRQVQYMLSIIYLMAYQGGELQPGDDMRGSQYRWWSLADLVDPEVQLLIPPGGKWLLQRAVELYRLWQGQEVELQPLLHRLGGV